MALAEATIARFGDPERGGFFSTSADHEQLIARRKELGDHPIPAGNSAAAFGLLRLAALSGERRYAEQAEGVLRLFARTAVRHPQSFAHLLRALDLWLEPGREVALVAPAGAGLDAAVGELAAAVRADFRPRLVLAAGTEGAAEPPLLPRPHRRRRPRRRLRLRELRLRASGHRPPTSCASFCSP